MDTDMFWPDVRLNEGNPDCVGELKRADVKGIWKPSKETLFYIAIN